MKLQLVTAKSVELCEFLSGKDLTVSHGLAPSTILVPCGHLLTPLTRWDGEENQKEKVKLVG